MVAQVTSLAIDRASFPVADCVHCGRQTLAYASVDAGDLQYRCLTCDQPLAESALGLAGRKSVESLGYVFSDRERSTAPARKSSCGANGVRGCGSGGCSSGSCGSGGSSGCGGSCSSK